MKEMTFVDHLDELRHRVIRILIILAMGFAVCYWQGEHLAEILLTPLRNALGESGKVVYLGVLDKVVAQFQLAFWASFVLGSPVIFWQIWLFIRPGLFDAEIKMIRPFIILAFFLFCLGVGFGYFLVFPLTFETLMNFGVTDIEATIGIRDYLILSIKVLIFLGLMFQIPNVMIILTLIGIVSAGQWSSYRKYVAAGFAILSSMITPPDVFTMLFIWGPLMILYEAGIWVVRLLPRTKSSI